jgi:hypothetical protein
MLGQNFHGVGLTGRKMNSEKHVPPGEDAIPVEIEKILQEVI